MQRFRAFTLIEIALSIFILLLILVLAVPSLSGVIANRRLKQSVDSFNQLVRQAQERSVIERRAYLIVWGKNSVLLRPEVFAEGEETRLDFMSELLDPMHRRYIDAPDAVKPAARTLQVGCGNGSAVRLLAKLQHRL